MITKQLSSSKLAVQLVLKNERGRKNKLKFPLLDNVCFIDCDLTLNQTTKLPPNHIVIDCNFQIADDGVF